MTRAISLVLFVAACRPTVPLAADATSTADDADAADSDSVSETTVISFTGSVTATGDPQDTGGAEQGSSGADDDGNGFIPTPDGGGLDVECDVWANDCPPGQKCMPWASDGGTAWNATKCSPVAEDPQQVDEPCTMQDSPVSGVDDCEAWAMCWNVDPETLMGTCVGFCTGGAANPSCEDPCKTCPIHGDGVLILCLPRCDPLVQNCDEGQACYVVNDEFVCAIDASGDMGAFGDGCDFANVCDPGLFCASASSVPDCVGSSGCCASFCDPLAADPCVGTPDGLACIPLFEEGGQQPECVLGVIGACLLPK